MELHQRLKQLSKQFNKQWRSLHKKEYSSEINQNSLYWIREISSNIESLEKSLLELEKALSGEKMPEDRKMELENYNASQDMIRRWMPLIIYGEMNNLAARTTSQNDISILPYTNNAQISN